MGKSINKQRILNIRTLLFHNDDLKETHTIIKIGEENFKNLNYKASKKL